MSRRDATEGPPTCPMCRAPWKNEPLLKSLHIPESLDAQAVQGYLDWLYSGTLRVAPGISRKSDSFNVALLKCWAVAGAVQDECFRNVVVGAFFGEARARFWSDSVHWTFVEGGANEEIKGFVVEVFMAYMKPGWFGEQGNRWPEEFVRVLADKALEGMVGRKGYPDVKRKWLRNLRDADGEVEEEGSRWLDKGKTDDESFGETSKAKDEVVEDEDKDLQIRMRRLQSTLSSDWRAWKW
jgi:hypothetical protein